MKSRSVGKVGVWQRIEAEIKCQLFCSKCVFVEQNNLFKHLSCKILVLRFENSDFLNMLILFYSKLKVLFLVLRNRVKGSLNALQWFIFN